MGKKGILVVSFGTSYLDAQQDNIVPVEQAIADALPEYEMRRAFGSGMIIKKLLKRDGIVIDTVEEALERFCQDGYSDLIIQPTYIIQGIEFDELKETVARYRMKFESIRIGYPLLDCQDDYVRIIQALDKEFGFKKSQDAFVFVGHGTGHFANACYPALEQQLHTSGFSNVFVGTVEGYPQLEDVQEQLKKAGFRKVTLIPLMLVAGDHAHNDIAGDDEDSWKSTLERDGLSVSCVQRGMGSYPLIQRMFAEHARQAK